MTYRELQDDLNNLFVSVDPETMDNEITSEDLQAIIDTCKASNDKLVNTDFVDTSRSLDND